MRCCRWIGVVVDNVLFDGQKKSPASTGLLLAERRPFTPAQRRNDFAYGARVTAMQRIAAGE
jgi:hypothetical protein